MLFADLLFFSTNFNVNQSYNNIYNDHKYIKIQNIVNKNNDNKINTINKIGIIDFRFILKKSNAMKILGQKFLLLENKINQKIKQKQNYFKKKEEGIKKNKSTLSDIEYKNKIKLFKEEVFQIQKKYKEERSLMNKSFQKIQKDIKDILAKIIKDVSIRKNINIVLLKENVFLFNNKNIDFTDEVLELFNNKTKSMKIIITSPK